MGMLESVGGVLSVNTDRRPFVPLGLELVQHRGYGKIPVDLDHVVLWSPSPQTEEVVRGADVQRSLQGKMVANANLLEVLLYNTKLIPLDWKEKEVWFLGTEYSLHGRPYVRVLSYAPIVGWAWREEWLGVIWEPHYAVALHEL